MRPLLLGTIGDGGVQQQIVDLVLTELLQRPLGKRLDALEIVELTLHDIDGVGRAVELESVIVLLGSLRVPGAEDDLVGLSLLEELLDSFEALFIFVLGGQAAHRVNCHAYQARGDAGSDDGFRNGCHGVSDGTSSVS